MTNLKNVSIIRLVKNDTRDYDWLRRHIHSQFNLMTQIFIASVVSSGALLGYIISIMAGGDFISKVIEQMQITSSDFSIAPFLLLTPIIIVLPCAYFISTLRKEMFLWGMYIKVFLEDGENGGWETNVSKFRERFQIIESFNPIALTYGGIVLICCMFYIYVICQTNMSLLWLIVVALIIGFHLMWWIDFRDIPLKCSRDYEKKWKLIKGDGLKGNE